MGKIVIAVYQPKEGKDEYLIKVLRKHLSVLDKENLVTGRKPIVMKSKENFYIEIFEWKSNEAIDEAHSNKNVLKLWDEFNRVCKYVEPNKVSEFNLLFPNFEPVNL